MSESFHRLFRPEGICGNPSSVVELPFLTLLRHADAGTTEIFRDRNGTFTATIGGTFRSGRGLQGLQDSLEPEMGELRKRLAESQYRSIRDETSRPLDELNLDDVFADILKNTKLFLNCVGFIHRAGHNRAEFLERFCKENGKSSDADGTFADFILWAGDHGCE